MWRGRKAYRKVLGASFSSLNSAGTVVPSTTIEHIMTTTSRAPTLCDKNTAYFRAVRCKYDACTNRKYQDERLS